MRKIRMAVVPIAMACTFAVTAAPALATHQFTASALGKTNTKEISTQEFRFGAFHITCKRARSAASGGPEITESPTQTLYVVVKFSQCTTAARLGEENITLATKFPQRVDFEYHANGFVESGSESESEMSLVNPGSVQLTVQAVKCTINWPAQTIPIRAEKHPEEEFASVIFKNEEVASTRLKLFPTGFQKELAIVNELKKIKFSYEGGQCENFKKTEGSGGTYKGTLRDQVVNANLSWE